MAGYYDRDEDQTPTPVEKPAAATPYCGKCGHNLTGLTESSRCPECGAAFVDHLMRGGVFGKRYESSTRLFGLPLVSIAWGPVPGERIGRAKGVFAMGDKARGLVAMGGQAMGLVAIGGIAIGGVTIGGVSLGVLGGLGGVAVGALASGGLAIGVLAYGGVGLGFFAAGGVAIGYYAFGGLPLGVFTFSGGPPPQEFLDMHRKVSWFFGPNVRSVRSFFQPMLAVLGLGALITGVIGLLGIGAHRRANPGGKDGFAPPS